MPSESQRRIQIKGSGYLWCVVGTSDGLTAQKCKRGAGSGSFLVKNDWGGRLTLIATLPLGCTPRGRLGERERKVWGVGEDFQMEFK